MDAVIRVGFWRNVMEPEDPIPLAGYGNDRERYHKQMTEDICATCVAVSDDADSTVLIIGFDLAVAPNALCQTLRERISGQTGVPEDRIYIAGTHTHAGPTLGFLEVPAVAKYYEQVKDAVCDAAVKAMADRKPARLFTGSIEVEHMNFVKHYKLRDAKGNVSYFGDLFGDPAGKFMVEHATQGDPTMHLVKFVREGGKDVAIANWRAHPHFRGGQKAYDLSSDYIGPFRDVVEAMLDCHCLFLQGAAGNMNSSTRLQAERRYSTARSYGAALAASAVEGLSNCMTEVSGGKVRTEQITFHGKINHGKDYLVPEAQKIADYWNETFDLAACKEMGKPHGIRSPYHAEAILLNAERTDEKDGWMVLNALAIGDDFALVTFPGELFDAISVRMEGASPFGTTMLMGYCHHHIGYLPSLAAFRYSSYETDITRFQAGTGEEVADTYVRMLKDLK